MKQELFTLSLDHFVFRSLMLEAERSKNIDIYRLSFAGYFRILQGRLPESDSRTPDSLNQ